MPPLTKPAKSKGKSLPKTLKKPAADKPQGYPTHQYPTGKWKVPLKGRFKENIDYMVLLDAKKLPPNDWPKLRSNCIPNTHYRVGKQQGMFRCFVTILPTGLRTAWASCGECHQHVVHCACPSGVLHPQSIEWLYVNSMIELNEPQELASARLHILHPLVEKYGSVFYRRNKETGRVTGERGYKPLKPQTGTQPRKTLKKASERRTEPVKATQVKSLKRKQPVVSTEPPAKVDLSGKQAKGQAEDLMRKFKKLSKG